MDKISYSITAERDEINFNVLKYNYNGTVHSCCRMTALAYIGCGSIQHRILPTSPTWLPQGSVCHHGAVLVSENIVNSLYTFNVKPSYIYADYAQQELCV